MAKKIKPIPKQTCGDCIHRFACAAWNVGSITNADATNCTNYEPFDATAIRVVRCKECVKCDTWKCHMEQTEHHPDGDIHHVYHGENDYCSYGEKREDKI